MKFYNYKSRWLGLYENTIWESDVNILRRRYGGKQPKGLTEDSREIEELCDSEFLARLGHWQYEQQTSTFCLCLSDSLKAKPIRGVIAKISTAHGVHYLVESNILWLDVDVTVGKREIWKTTDTVAQAVEEIEKEFRGQLLQISATIETILNPAGEKILSN